MNITVINQSMSFENSQVNQKKVGEQQERFNQTFSSLLNKNSMDASSEQPNKEAEFEEMMDDLVSSMMALPLVAYTQFSQDLAINKETAQSLLEDSVPSSLSMIMLTEGQLATHTIELENTLPDITTVGQPQLQNHPLISLNMESTLRNENMMSLNNQSPLSENMMSLNNQSPLSENIVNPTEQLVNDELDGWMMESEDVSLLNGIKHLKAQMSNQVNSSSSEAQDFLNYQENVDEGLAKVSNDSEGNLGELSQVIATNLSFTEVMTQEVSPKSNAEVSYMKWENQSEIIESIRHQMTLLKENDVMTLQLKLYPQHLGSISVELKMKNGVINANVLVEQSQLKEIIEQEFHQINFDGTSIEQLNVEVNAQTHQQSKPQELSKSSKQFKLEEELIEEVEVVDKKDIHHHIGHLNLTV